MSEERPSSTEQDVVLVNEDRQNSEASVESGNRPFSSFLADALNAEDDNEPFMELPEVPMQHPLFDAPPVVPDSLQQFRPSNWRGLMAAIQNEPIDPIQVLKLVNFQLVFDCSWATTYSKKPEAPMLNTRFFTFN